MNPVLQAFFWLAVLAAFCVNLWCLGAELAAGLRRASGRGKLAAAGLLAAGLLAGHLAFGGAAPRAGYDNDHDLQYLGASFFDPRSLGDTFSGKEVSPLLLDAAGDLLSGNSLAAVPVKNRALTFLAAALLFACLLRLGLGLPAAFCGFAVLYFNFLAGLNAATFSTTPANLFYLCCALYAAAAFDAGGGSRRLLWALCSLFLVWAGRYELAVLPGLLLAASLRPGGELRRLVRGASGRPAAAYCAAAAGLCALWYLKVAARFPYNGPAPRELLRAARHLSYQLWLKDLAVISPLPLWACWLLAAAAFALVFARAAALRDGRRLALAAALLAGTAFLSAVYAPLDEYPLHFMRHQLYFLLPFACLAALAWDAAWGGRAARWNWAALAALCAVYLRANAAAAAGLNGELRTNDREWSVLLEASRRWPRGCALVYGQNDLRRGVLKKYFPLLSGDCSVPPPACVFKYVPARCQVFTGPENGRPEGCSAQWLPGAVRAGAPLAEASFEHRFYTIFRESELRRPVPVRAGFYPADGPADKALLLDGEGLCGLKRGAPGPAAEKFRAALAADPACRGCALDLAAALALGGGPGALPALKREVRSASSPAELALLAGLLDAASGDGAAAARKLGAVSGDGSAGRARERAFAYGEALRRTAGFQGRGQ